MRVRRAVAAAVISFGLAAPLAMSVALAAGPAPKPAEADIAKTRGGTWASIATLPNMGGVWETYRPRPAPGAPPAPRPEEPPLTPEYTAKKAAWADAVARGVQEDSETANCVPPGLPDVMTQPYPIELLFTPGKLTVAIEAYSQMRRIFTDGRPHGSPDQTFNGHSVGHWEGDELVVDTVGFDPQTRLAVRGVQHSELMHIVERFKLTEKDLLQVTVTIDDPKALTKPWTRVNTYARHADWDIAEYICEQNNRNLVDASGKAGVVLKGK
ncbi:MAG: hypothetical protein ABIO39_09735 [Caulobacteraceae bacterium]